MCRGSIGRCKYAAHYPLCLDRGRIKRRRGNHTMKQVQERLIRDEVSQSQTLICEPAPHGPQLPYFWLSALSFAKLIPLMFLRIGLGVCASCLFLGTAWAQEDPLDKPFTQPLYLIHITGTGTINGPT